MCTADRSPKKESDLTWFSIDIIQLKHNNLALVKHSFSRNDRFIISFEFSAFMLHPHYSYLASLFYMHVCPRTVNDLMDLFVGYFPFLEESLVKDFTFNPTYGESGYFCRTYRVSSVEPIFFLSVNDIFEKKRTLNFSMQLFFPRFHEIPSFVIVEILPLWQFL